MPLLDAIMIIERVKEFGGEIVPIEQGMIRYRGPALTHRFLQLKRLL